MRYPTYRAGPIRGLNFPSTIICRLVKFLLLRLNVNKNFLSKTCLNLQVMIKINICASLVGYTCKIYGIFCLGSQDSVVV